MEFSLVSDLELTCMHEVINSSQRVWKEAQIRYITFTKLWQAMIEGIYILASACMGIKEDKASNHFEI